MSTTYRLVLWNIDHTLVDVGRVTRDAYAEAFQRVTGRPLVRLAPVAGRTESEIIFETLAFNDIDVTDDHLPAFMTELARTFAARRDRLRAEGRLLPGAKEATAALARRRGTVQSVLTGSIRPNAVLKLAEFGLDSHLDTEVGGYEDGVYSKAALLELARRKASQKHGIAFDDSAAWQEGDAKGATVYVADSTRDVQAAKIARAAVLAVATGSATEAELRAAGADVVLPTLADTGTVVRAVEHLTAPAGA
ncbi:Phosphoglycolate phosphatase, HAD superfamily [Thermomonospora echinospora]|uniref:Phosphoglycolate phosphatase, HAD superfamily n=1 Tax=Thermomonospora echinospora TaxID=1992 RepID=A0A1H5W7C2_9ACTN|nr:haloacid dehalogenase-like hydrolase [Thermomonospora echinospora]SEF95238.1 Phosphoglycolate phosphatase, HAD superfamily [Thermomonospora echinospora]